jgi:DUF4097 and DUF4098 domain-containing protein YvlB
MIRQQYETPGEVFLRVSNKAGPVEVHAYQGQKTEIEVTAQGDAGVEAVANTKIDHVGTDGGHRVLVEVPARSGLLRPWPKRGTSVRVSVQVPEGAAVQVETAGGEVSVEGRLGQTGVQTASGDVSIERIDADLRVRTASGDVKVAAVSGEVSIHTASGDVRGGTIEGAGEIKTASGDVRVEAAGGGLLVQTASGDVSTGHLAAGCRVKTASGDLRVGCLSGGRAELETVTGDIKVAVARGALVAVDAVTVSGSLSSEIDLEAEAPDRSGDDDTACLDLHARTVSGDLRIERAALA